MKKRTMIFLLLFTVVSIYAINEVKNRYTLGQHISHMATGNHMKNMDMSGHDMHNMEMGHDSAVQLTSSKGLNEIVFPKVLQPDRRSGQQVEYTLKAQQGTTDFIKGHSSQTFGYNGSLLGPVIMLNKGEQVKMNLVNQLPEETTVHWHGLSVAGDVDGGPDEAIAPDATRTVNFKVDQDESTLWFHPHPHMYTTSQVYKGLAGLLYIKDDVKRQLPETYGVDDLPIIIQDRTFKDDKLVYETIKNSDGTTGQDVLVNGSLNPKLTLKANQVRLRLLNGSNARNLNLKLSNGMTFDYIASDGGYLEAPMRLQELTLAPGERKEIVLDLTASTDETVNLVDADNTVILPIHRADHDSKSISPLKRAASHEPLITNNKVTKTIQLAGMGPMVTLNNEQFDADKINLKQRVGKTEVWQIENLQDHMGGMKHPFHIHGTQFKVLSIDGKKPDPQFAGYKDTISLEPGQTAKIAVRFKHRGVFMYHCHVLEHEENGMMGQIKVY